MKKEMLDIFKRYLQEEERSSATQEKYLYEVIQFFVWLGDEEVTKEIIVKWKQYLIQKGYKPSTINCKLSALDQFLNLIGRSDCKVKHLRLQRRLFREVDRELTKTEYERLVTSAYNSGKERLALLMESICSTGIRVSEVKYLTVKAAQVGKAEIIMKGKIRTILISNKLCRKLLKYAKKQKIVSGEIFLTKDGKSLNRKQIWAQMKSICEKAGIVPAKVFPHNLRHLFAQTFYKVSRDVVKLADALGHSNIETTRIYLISTGSEHAKIVDQLRLLL